MQRLALCALCAAAILLGACGVGPTQNAANQAGTAVSGPEAGTAAALAGTTVGAPAVGTAAAQASTMVSAQAGTAAAMVGTAASGPEAGTAAAMVGTAASGPEASTAQALAGTAASGALAAVENDVAVKQGEALVLDASNSAGDIKDYKWTITKAPAGAESVVGQTIKEGSSGNVSLSPDDYAKYFPTSGDYTVRLIVTDAQGATANSDFTVTVP
jgi:hypothetical protein